MLANPWQLFLAVKAYDNETSDPAELVTMTPDQASQLLLSALIPAVTDHDDTADTNGWTAPDAQHWLTSIADHQYRSSIEWRYSLIDIRLPELWRIGGTYPRWISPIILFTIPLPIAAFILLLGRNLRMPDSWFWLEFWQS